MKGDDILTTVISGTFALIAIFVILTLLA